MGKESKENSEYIASCREIYIFNSYKKWHVINTTQLKLHLNPALQTRYFTHNVCVHMIAVTVAMFKRSVLPIGERFRDCPRKSRNRGKQIDSVINIPECFTTTFDIWKIVICDPLKVVFFFCFCNKNFMTLKERDMEHDTTRHSLLNFFFKDMFFLFLIVSLRCI